MSRLKKVVLRASKDYVSDFVTRWVTDNREAPWADLKKELSIRFGEVIDMQHAFTLLRQLKQKPEENVQIYAQRLIALAEQAFAGETNSGIYEQQMIGFFVDGLHSDQVRIRVMRANPQTFNSAVSIARSEQVLKKRLALRIHSDTPDLFTHHTSDDRIEEAMDISLIRRKRCQNCGRPNHLTRDCRARPTHGISELSSRDTSGRDSRPPVICWGCNLPGHILRYCPSSRRQQQQQQQRQNDYTQHRRSPNKYNQGN